MQAFSFGQSVFIVHSGLQLGGLPLYCGKQEQDGEFPTLRPHGEGKQGSVCTTTSLTGINNKTY
jgi:hypothetical protein